jgi:hypothetical protein
MQIQYTLHLLLINDLYDKFENQKRKYILKSEV